MDKAICLIVGGNIKQFLPSNNLLSVEPGTDTCKYLHMIKAIRGYKHNTLEFKKETLFYIKVREGIGVKIKHQVGLRKIVLSGSVVNRQACIVWS